MFNKNKQKYSATSGNIYSPSGEVVGMKGNNGEVFGREEFDVRNKWYTGQSEHSSRLPETSTVGAPASMSPMYTDRQYLADTGDGDTWLHHVQENPYGQETFNKELDVQKGGGLMSYLKGIFAPRSQASGPDAKFRTAYSADEGRMYESAPKHLGEMEQRSWSRDRSSRDYEPGGAYSLDVTRRGSEGYDTLYGAANVNSGLKGLLQRALPGGESGYSVQGTDLGSGTMYHDNIPEFGYESQDNRQPDEMGYSANRYPGLREFDWDDKATAVNRHLREQGRLYDDEYFGDRFSMPDYKFSGISGGDTYGNK